MYKESDIATGVLAILNPAPFTSPDAKHTIMQNIETQLTRIFLQTLSACFSELNRNSAVTFSSPCRTKIQLCLSQISKSLRLFGKLLNQPLYRQGVWYLCERLQCCVSELCQAVNSSKITHDCENDNSGSFLHRIDLALQLLETHSTNVPPTWKQLINDIVCQAVTIAKMATSVDCKEITSACQRLLRDNSQLSEEEINSNHLALLKDSLSSSLTCLEQRVSVAILRLVLQVFSEPNKPLKLLVRKCGQLPEQRRLADLDQAVADLDAHVERVVVIGQFAVSCSEDTKIVECIRCCLASVESVDNYLVPALKALYLTPSCKNKRLFAQLLCEHWQDEIEKLQSYLDAIIDSSALSKVVQESVSDLHNRLCSDEAADEVGKTIVKQAWLLYKHLSATAGSAVDLSQLKKTTHECEAAVTKQAPCAAILKRVGLVMVAIDKITDQLTNTPLRPQSPLKDKTVSDSFELVQSIRDLPLDISLASSTRSQIDSYRPQWLQRKISDAKRNIRSEFSNLENKIEEDTTREGHVSNPITPKSNAFTNACETPKNQLKNEENLLTPFLNQTAGRNVTLYVRTPRKVIQSHVMELSSLTDCSWSTVNNSDSWALDISDILDNLSMLADSLSSEKETNSISWNQPQPTPPAEVMKRYFSGSSFDSQWFSLASVRTEEVSADVNTPERIQDLKDVDEKLRNLKLL